MTIDPQSTLSDGFGLDFITTFFKSPSALVDDLSSGTIFTIINGAPSITRHLEPSVIGSIRSDAVSDQHRASEKLVTQLSRPHRTALQRDFLAYIQDQRHLQDCLRVLPQDESASGVNPDNAAQFSVRTPDHGIPTPSPPSSGLSTPSCPASPVTTASGRSEWFLGLVRPNSEDPWYESFGGQPAVLQIFAEFPDWDRFWRAVRSSLGDSLRVECEIYVSAGEPSRALKKIFDQRVTMRKDRFIRPLEKYLQSGHNNARLIKLALLEEYVAEESKKGHSRDIDGIVCAEQQIAHLESLMG